MTVYVDALFATAPSNRWPYKQACHMFTDGSKDELHSMADRLGLKRAYFQRHATLWHYDLTPSKRAQALRLGAKYVEGREYSTLMLRLVAERRS